MWPTNLPRTLQSDIRTSNDSAVCQTQSIISQSTNCQRQSCLEISQTNVTNNYPPPTPNCQYNTIQNEFIKPLPHQQQCRSNIRLCQKNRSTCSIRQCCWCGRGLTRRLVQAKNWNQRRERRLLLGVISRHAGEKFKVIFKTIHYCRRANGNYASEQFLSEINVMDGWMDIRLLGYKCSHKTWTKMWRLQKCKAVNT